ncbi:MAG TPA: hypothetical protein VMZ91_05285 [Candidatus Paceibacterota bacterium]|nr:hypothetical protein [Candidatus Paceibacterota bacterium]
MIKITVELIPYGIKEASHEIASMIIANDGTGTHELGNYKYIITSNTEEDIRGTFKGYERKKMIWSLIKAILKKEKNII